MHLSRITKRQICFITAALFSIAGTWSDAKQLRIGVVQSVIEDTLAKNEAKLLHFIDKAKSAGCRMVIFPENALYWSEMAIDDPSKCDLDAAIERIGMRARRTGQHVVFGTAYKSTDEGRYHNYGVVFDGQGKRRIFYRKNVEVPQIFDVDGVPCNLAVCSDRGYLEYSDLPALVQRSQIIIDTSGGHGGDDGGDQLPLIRYRPWALRTGAFVIVSNPVHDDTDFMGRSPWGGGSAIIKPDGSIQSHRKHDKDVLVVQNLQADEATVLEAIRRRNHPVFKSFWDMGQRLLEDGTISYTKTTKPYLSAVRDIKIAAAQIACSTDIGENISKIREFIGRAAQQSVDVVVFPELAVTGARGDDILAATSASLDDALTAICSQAKSKGVYVIVGMPYFIDGTRRNCALVIDDQGEVQTRYAQIVTSRNDLFSAGTSTKAMWFQLKGVHAIVTVGDDANWVEIGDLAANRGMYLHFHLSYRQDSSAEDATLRKQNNLLALMYAKYGAMVNAADPSSLPKPSLPASGMSMIVSREGGHEQPAPPGIEYYLPYQTSVVKGAGTSETILQATRRTTSNNNWDLDHHWRNRNRKRRAQGAWHKWVQHGAWLIESTGDD